MKFIKKNSYVIKSEIVLLFKTFPNKINFLQQGPDLDDWNIANVISFSREVTQTSGNRRLISWTILVGY